MLVESTLNDHITYDHAFQTNGHMTIRLIWFVYFIFFLGSLYVSQGQILNS